jgi:hypothetical protein
LAVLANSASEPTAFPDATSPLEVAQVVDAIGEVDGLLVEHSIPRLELLLPEKTGFR